MIDSPLTDILAKRRLDVKRVLGKRHWKSAKAVSKEIGVSHKNVYKLIHAARILGVEKIIVDDKPLYLIPDDYTVIDGKLGRPRKTYTRIDYEKYLNKKGVPSNRTIVTKSYGSWLKKNNPRLFARMHKTWKRKALYQRDYKRNEYRNKKRSMKNENNV